MNQARGTHAPRQAANRGPLAPHAGPKAPLPGTDPLASPSSPSPWWDVNLGSCLARVGGGLGGGGLGGGLRQRGLSATPASSRFGPNTPGFR